MTMASQINPASEPTRAQKGYDTDRYVVFDVLTMNNGPAVTQT